MLEPASFASSPRRIRQSNEVAVLRALHQDGRLSRADLARRLSLNRSSSGHIIAGLAAAGLVREVAEEPGSKLAQPRAGRPGILVELIPEAVAFVGMEIGVEHISVVALDLAARVVATAVEPHDSRATGLHAALQRAAAFAFETVPRERWDRCEGLGISMPAQMSKQGMVRLAPLLGWRDFYPAELIRGFLPLSVPILAENDANAFAIGDTYRRAVSRRGVTLFMVMETGVGGGIVIDGTLFRGANGLAGEIGHLRVPTEVGIERNLEEVIGLEAILGEYRKVATPRSPDFSDFLADVQDRAPLAVAVAERWAKALAFGMVQACRIIDADQIVLGGSVAALYPLVAARVAAHLSRLGEASFPPPTIELDESATWGSAFGAACIMHQRYLSLESQRFTEEVPHDDLAELAAAG